MARHCPLMQIDVLAEIDRLGTAEAVAEAYEVTPSGVWAACRRARDRRGEKLAPRDCSWDARLRYRPTVKQIEDLLRLEGVEGCVARWGATPGTLLKTARKSERAYR